MYSAEEKINSEYWDSLYHCVELEKTLEMQNYTIVV
jgi:hypothetical protein